MEIDPNNPDQVRRRNLSFAAVAGMGVVALVLGFVQLSNSIRKPLQLPENRNSALSYEDIQSLGNLREKDTDKDGISDYDELYTYKTSPYLKDSDSDGIDDRTEIEGGADPNCPKGQTCGSVAGGTNGNVNAGGGNANAAPGLGTSNISASALRETLKNAGVPQAQLDELDDATLLKLYGDVLAETPSPSNANASAGNLNLSNIPANAAVSQESLEKLTPAEIRQLLISAGVDSQLLNNIDDVTLRAIFLQAIEGGTPTQ